MPTNLFDLRAGYLSAATSLPAHVGERLHKAPT
jgi:hypothetical protein